MLFGFRSLTFEVKQGIESWLSPSCVVFFLGNGGKSLIVSMPQFPYMQNGNNTHTCLIGLCLIYLTYSLSSIKGGDVSIVNQAQSVVGRTSERF